MGGTEDSNGEAGVYPAAIYVPIFAAIAVLLNIPPFYWHFRHRNVAASSLILWLVLLNICNVINPIIWPNDNISKWWNGKVLCDIQARLFVGATVGLTGALACIMQGLARVMDTNRAVIVPSKAQRRRQCVLDLLFCWGCPVYLMLVYYIVQPARYCIWGISGCNFVVDNSWPSIWLIFIWPPVFSLIDAYYSGLVIYRLHRHRRQFSRLLQTADTTKSRFLRLFLMTLVLVFGTLPIQFYLFALSLKVPRIPYSWAAVHADWDLVVMIPNGGILLLDHWVRIVCGYFVFFFFGMGADATEMYRGWLVKIGCARVWPRLDRRRNSFGGRAPFGGGGSWGSRVGKVFVKKSGLTATTSSLTTWAPSSDTPTVPQPPTPKRTLFSFFSFRSKSQSMALPMTQTSSAQTTLPSIRRSSTFSDFDPSNHRSVHSSILTPEDPPAKEIAVPETVKSFPSADAGSGGHDVLAAGGQVG